MSELGKIYLEFDVEDQGGFVVELDGGSSGYIDFLSDKGLKGRRVLGMRICSKRRESGKTEDLK